MKRKQRKKQYIISAQLESSSENVVHRWVCIHVVEGSVLVQSICTACLDEIVGCVMSGKRRKDSAHEREKLLNFFTEYSLEVWANLPKRDCQTKVVARVHRVLICRCQEAGL